MGRDDVFDRLRWSDCFFTVAMVWTVGGRVAGFRIFGDFANGSYKYNCAKSRAGRTAQPRHGRLRDDVYGSAADRFIGRGSAREAVWRSGNARGLRSGLLCGQLDLLLARRALGAKCKDRSSAGLVHCQNNDAINFVFRSRRNFQDNAAGRLCHFDFVAAD